MEETNQGTGAHGMRHPRRTFAAAMLFYLLLVHGTSIGLRAFSEKLVSPPDPELLSGWSAHILAWEVACFGTVALCYQVFNLVLLYGIMLALFFYVRHTVRGPWWLGSLAAAMLMANPVKSEAVLSANGVGVLFPALLLLSAMAVYAANVCNRRLWRYCTALGLGAAALFAAPFNACLPLLVLLHEAFIATKTERNWRRPMPFFVLGILALLQTPFAFADILDAPARLIPPLHFVLYPIGFLPETVEWFHRYPATAWACIALALALAALLIRKARHPALTFGAAAAFVAGWTWCVQPIDPVRLTGGGQLLLPAAFCMVAFAGFCHAVWRHRKWRRPVVLITGLLCVLLFTLQWRANWEWRQEPPRPRTSATDTGGVLPLVPDEDAVDDADQE